MEDRIRAGVHREFTFGSTAVVPRLQLRLISARWSRPSWLRNPSAHAAAIWIAVYGLIWSTGQGFSTNFLRYGWQIVPWPTLRSHPLTSVWYLHIQPPVWNLILGCLGRWSPMPIALTLQLFSIAAGAVLAGTLAALLTRIDVTRRAATIVALVATINPPVLRLAFDAQYELFVAMLIVVLLWAVAAPMTTKPSHRFLIISAIATTIVMTRSIYQVPWLVLLLVPIANAARKQVSPRVMAAIFIIPLVTIGGWTLKNQIVFGEATLTTWSGMNQLKSVSPTFTTAELQRLAGRGDVSAVAVVGPFQPYANYVGAVPACRLVHRDPAVSAQQSSEPSIGLDGGQFYTTNFNNECYIPIYNIAGRDATYLTTHYPGRWFEARLWSARVWFSSGSANERSGSVVLGAIDDLFAVARVDLPAPAVSTHGWQQDAFILTLGNDDVSWLVVAFTVLVLAAGARHLIRRLRRRGGGRRANVMIVAAFVLAWTFGVGIAGELGEQARFRTMTDPFVVSLGIVLAWSVLQRLRKFVQRQRSRQGGLLPR